MDQLELELPIADDQKKRDEWCEKITTYQKAFEKWEKRCDKIIDAYRDERKADDDSLRARRYNMFWSNVQTLGPAVFSKSPKVEVSRRYGDKDAIGRIACAVLERAVSYEMDVTGFFEEAMNVRSDYLLCGRGTLWQRYEPVIENAAQDPDDDDAKPGNGAVTTPGAMPGVEAMGANGGPPMERVIGENAPTDYVHWKDFLHGPAQTWKQVPWVGRKVLMDKASVDKRWPAKQGEEPLSKQLSFTHKQHKDTDDNKQSQKKGNLAIIYELCDKTTFKFVWYSPDLKTRVIEEVDDPLELQDFFPCAEPLYATMTTDRLEPRPDYVLYQDQIAELNTLTQRIALLQKTLAIRGVYDRSNKELSDLLNERPENFMVPVDNWAAFAEKGGLQGQMSFVPIDQIMKVIQGLQAARQIVIQDIYSITGMSDIVRGASNASETATAQQIKGQFANLRLNSRRDAMARFLRDSIRIKAQVVAQHFDPGILRKISGFDQMTEIDTMKKANQDVDKVWAQVYNMLSDDPLRLTHLDVQTDSIVEADRQEEQQSRTQFLEAVSQFLEKAVQTYQTMPELGPLMAQMLSFGIRGFRIGRELEGVIDTALDQLTQQAQNPQPKPPSPDMIDAQARMTKAQADADHQKAEDALAIQKQRTEDYQVKENIKLARDELLLKYGISPFVEAALAEQQAPGANE